MHRPGRHVRETALDDRDDHGPQFRPRSRRSDDVAGAEAHLYAVAQGDLDEVDPPRGSTEDTVAVEIRGDSLGSFFNRWLVFYDDVRRPVTPDLIGELCIVGLEDGRILIKQVQRSRTEGLFNLLSSTEKPIFDVAIEWAARVNSIARRSRT